MKIKVIPVRQMKKGRTKVWVKCDESSAQAYELRSVKGKLLRRERSADEAHRLVGLFGKTRAKPKDKRSLIGCRWSDVKDKL